MRLKDVEGIGKNQPSRVPNSEINWEVPIDRVERKSRSNRGGREHSSNYGRDDYHSGQHGSGRGGFFGGTRGRGGFGGGRGGYNR
jgi:hypothetical protein